MSGFVREINDFNALKRMMDENSFLYKINNELVKNGKAFLALRNNEITIYYNGNQLCNAANNNGYLPTVYNHYLPFIRSKSLLGKIKKENYSESKWREIIKVSNANYEDIFEEILDNIEKEKTPESLQVSRLYAFSPLNENNDSKIILIDVEAAFAEAGEKTDRIDMVFYNIEDRRLLFVEVKRLSDNRLYPQKNCCTDPEIIEQLNRYNNRLKTEKDQINDQYNKVINFFNNISGRTIPTIEKEPLLGLLLVEYHREDIKRKNSVVKMVKEKGYKVYSIGDTANIASENTLEAIYKEMLG